MKPIIGAAVITVFLAVVMQPQPTRTASHKQLTKTHSVAYSPHVTADKVNATASLPKPVTAPVQSAQTAVAQSAVPATPAPQAPVSTPTVVEASSPCSVYDKYFNLYAWNVSIARAICQAESGGNPNAVSPTADYGIMQIHDGLQLYGNQIFDPAFNMSIAWIKYQTQGWHAWSTYNSGAYERYL